jgi:uncharacterized LabA/DUF88 family protein
LVVKKLFMSQFPKHPPSGEEPVVLPEAKEQGTHPSWPFPHTLDPIDEPADLLHIPEHGQTILFIDGVNLFYAASQLKIEIDYAKLLHLFSQDRHLVRALFYTGVDPRNEKQKNFLLWMQRHGYRVVTKELPVTPEGFHRVSMNVEIAIDMLTLAPHCHTEVVVSSDSDLSYAVQAVNTRGTQVEVVSLRTMTSDRLINAADHYIDLADLRHNIQKPPRPRTV